MARRAPVPHLLHDEARRRTVANTLGLLLRVKVAEELASCGSSVRQIPNPALRSTERFTLVLCPPVLQAVGRFLHRDAPWISGHPGFSPNSTKCRFTCAVRSSAPPAQ